MRRERAENGPTVEESRFPRSTCEFFFDRIQLTSASGLVPSVEPPREPFREERLAKKNNRFLASEARASEIESSFLDFSSGTVRGNARGMRRWHGARQNRLKSGSGALHRSDEHSHRDGFITPLLFCKGAWAKEMCLLLERIA